MGDRATVAIIWWSRFNCFSSPSSPSVGDDKRRAAGGQRGGGGCVDGTHPDGSASINRLAIKKMARGDKHDAKTFCPCICRLKEVFKKVFRSVVKNVNEFKFQSKTLCSKRASIDGGSQCTRAFFRLIVRRSEDFYVWR